jgi:putative serine protease PepD
MSEEQRPLEGQDDQARDQDLQQIPEQPAADLTVPVDLNSTLPLAGRPPVSYPPPAGGPLVHEPSPPASGGPLAHEPSPPAGDPFLGYPPPPAGDPFLGYPPPPSGPFVHLPPAPAEQPSASGLKVSAHPSERGGLRDLGPRAISALVVGMLATAVVAAMLGGVTGAYLVGRADGGAVALPAAPAGTLVRPEGSIAAIATRSLPSVVTIKVKGSTAEGTGSGFVLRKDGYILTNNHVVGFAAETGKITVLFSDGQSADAKIVGRDESYDLAVIRVDRNDLPLLALGVSSAVVVGDEVIAVGAPLGLDSTVTSGIVSALNRPVTAAGPGASSASFINAIQTDAAINPGNSGGPLLDMAGRVIGINSAIARVAGSDSPLGGLSGNIGVGFAIPSDQARKTAAQLIADGKATHPVIGASLDPTYQGEGVKISDTVRNGSAPIAKGGPADKAGVKPGDVVLKFAGKVVNDPDELVVAIRAKSIGDQVELTIRHGGAVRTVKITLQAAS